MLPVSTLQGGLAQAMPDVCKTPSPAGPVPVPYPNLAQLAAAEGFVPTVLVANKPVLVVSSKVSMSQGDEAGVAGGVVSGTQLGPVSFRQPSSKVSAGGKKVVFVTGATAHNGQNPNAPVGLQSVPSQMKVLVSP
jgi:hypothetical protein